MQRLILLRHGEAEGRAASGRDVDRALTLRGRAEARGAGEGLAALGVKPDVALVSRARRAQETWAEAQANLSAGRVEERPELYGAAPEAILADAEAEEAATVMVVAHNPGLQELAYELAPDEPLLAHGLPTGAYVVLAREGVRWRLAEFAAPAVVA